MNSFCLKTQYFWRINETNARNGIITNAIRFLEIPKLKPISIAIKLNSHKINIKIEYLELRNKFDLKKTLKIKNSKVFIGYYVNDVRLIDNF